MPAHPAQSHRHTSWPSTVRTTLVATLVVTLVLLAFIWPTRTSEVKDLPVDVVGNSAMAKAAGGQLEASGAFAVSTVDSRDAVIAHIKDRTSYAAIVPPAAPGGEIEVLTASAASPVVSQLMGQVATKIGQQAAEQAAAMKSPVVPAVKVTDVVPLTKDDPRGAGLAMAAMPLAMGGMIGGVLISLLVVGAWRRFAAVLGYAVFGGLAMAAVLGPWLGVLPEFGASALVIGAALLATGATIVGLQSLIGQPGIGLGAVITLFIGNPIASAGSPMEFLPGPWGAIGQFFVPGAACTALRLVNYFPDAPLTHNWLVLGAWSVVGLALIVTGHFRGQQALDSVATEPDEAPAKVPVSA